MANSLPPNNKNFSEASRRRWERLFNKAIADGKSPAIARRLASSRTSGRMKFGEEGK